MIFQGLYHLIAENRRAATEKAKSARRVDKDPRIAHECGVAADRYAKEADDMEAHAKSNEELMENLNKLLHYMASSKHSSRYRNLAMTEVERAIHWLHRENGDRTPEPS